MPGSVGAGGVWKNITGLYAAASGVWKASPGTWVGQGGVWRPWWAPFQAVMIPGTSGSSRGYANGLYGSITTNTYGGLFIAGIWQHTVSGGMLLVVSGFISNPGQSYFKQLTVETTIFAPPSSDNFNYLSGAATWTWNSPPLFLTNGVPVAVTLG